MKRQGHEEEAAKAWEVHETRQGRPATPAEIGDVVVLLSTPRMSLVVGHNLVIDGSASPCDSMYNLLMCFTEVSRSTQRLSSHARLFLSNGYQVTLARRRLRPKSGIYVSTFDPVFLMILFEQHLFALRHWKTTSLVELHFCVLRPAQDAQAVHCSFWSWDDPCKLSHVLSCLECPTRFRRVCRAIENRYVVLHLGELLKKGGFHSPILEVVGLVEKHPRHFVSIVNMVVRKYLFVRVWPVEIEILDERS